MFFEYEEDFIKNYLFHIRTLQDNMIFLEKHIDVYDFLDFNDFTIVDRALKHDLDKLNDDLINHYINISKCYYNKKNNNLEDIDISEDLKITDIKHHGTQRHHFYCNNIEGNELDAIETCCDIDTVSKRFAEKDNTYYFLNVMINKYPKLYKIKEFCLKIFKVLKEKKNEIKNIDKVAFIDKYINYIRKFQDNMIKLEKNYDILDFKKWEIFRFALNYNKYDFSNENIDKIYNKDDSIIFDFNKNSNDKFSELCFSCNAYVIFGKNCLDFNKCNKNIIEILIKQ